MRLWDSIRSTIASFDEGRFSDNLTLSFIIGCSNCKRRESIFLPLHFSSRALRIRLPTDRISLQESFKSNIWDKNISIFFDFASSFPSFFSPSAFASYTTSSSTIIDSAGG